MVFTRFILGAVVLMATLSLPGCGDDDAPDGGSDEAVAALEATLARLGTRDGEGFRAGLTARGLEDFARHEWGVSADHFREPRALDDAVEQSVYAVEAIRLTQESHSRLEIGVLRKGQPDFSEDRFALRRSNRGQWRIDSFSPRSDSPAVPAGYEQVQVEVREYALDSGDLPLLPQTTAFAVRNGGTVEHDIALLWLHARVPTEGFFFGVAEAWPPMLELYGSVRVAPGDTVHLIPRKPLEQRDGRYVLFCTIGERGPSHARLGMLEELPAR